MTAGPLSAEELRGIAAMAAALGGLDTLVFTGGVGERSAPVRAAAGEGLPRVRCAPC